MASKETPIEHAMNIGPQCSPELREVGITSLEKLKEIGWADTYRRVCAAFPDRIHSMYAYALIGAETDRNLLHLNDDEKRAARALTKELKAGY